MRLEARLKKAPALDDEHIEMFPEED